MEELYQMLFPGEKMPEGTTLASLTKCLDSRITADLPKVSYTLDLLHMTLHVHFGGTSIGLDIVRLGGFQVTLSEMRRRILRNVWSLLSALVIENETLKRDRQRKDDQSFWSWFGLRPCSPLRDLCT